MLKKVPPGVAAEGKGKGKDKGKGKGRKGKGKGKGKGVNGVDEEAGEEGWEEEEEWAEGQEKGVDDGGAVYDEFDFDAEMDEFGACAIDDLSDGDDDDMQLLWLCGDCDMSDVSELVDDPPISPELVAVSADFARYEVGALLADEGMAEISHRASGDEAEVMGVDVKRVPGLRDAPPIDEGSEYDPHARMDLVQDDDGPVHIHRRRGDLERTGKDVIWTEDDLTEPRAKLDPWTSEEGDPWSRIATPSTIHTSTSPMWSPARRHQPSRKLPKIPTPASSGRCLRTYSSPAAVVKSLHPCHTHGADRPQPPPRLRITPQFLFL